MSSARSGSAWPHCPMEASSLRSLPPEAPPNIRNTTAIPRLLLTSLISVSLVGQQQQIQQQQPPAQQQPQDAPFTIRTSVEEVTAPVLAFDRDGNFVNGLQPPQFHLFD